MNFAAFGSLILSGCAGTTEIVAPPKVSVAALSGSRKGVGAPTLAIAYSTAPIRGAALVYQRGHRLEAIALAGGQPTILRQRCEAGDFWDFSPDGRRLVFAATPGDVDFFDAGAFRSYVFVAPYNRGQKVLLAAYGKREVAPDDRPDFPEARFDASGRKLVVIEGQVPHFMDDPCGSWVSIWDVATRKRVWDGRRFVSQSKGKFSATLLRMYRFSAPVLSPDGNDIVCLGTYREGDRNEETSAEETSTELTRVVHFDLRHKTAEVVMQAGVPLSATGFVWHPSQKKFLFTGPDSTDSARFLFEFDLRTRQVKRVMGLTTRDFSAQWSPNGKQIYWIRGSVEARQAGANRIWRANADGSGATAILPQIVGATQLQILPHIAHWGRYRDIPIAALAGADK